MIIPIVLIGLINQSIMLEYMSNVAFQRDFTARSRAKYPIENALLYPFIRRTFDM